MVVLGCVFASPLAGVYRALTWWQSVLVRRLAKDTGPTLAGSLLTFGHLAVWGCPPQSAGLPLAFPWSVGRVGSLRRGARGPLGQDVMGLECRNQGGLVVWCLSLIAHWLVGPGAWGALPVGGARAVKSVQFAGRCVTASQVCGGPGVALA